MYVLVEKVVVVVAWQRDARGILKEDLLLALKNQYKNVDVSVLPVFSSTKHLYACILHKVVK